MRGLGCNICARFAATGRRCEGARFSKFAKFEIVCDAMLPTLLPNALLPNATNANLSVCLFVDALPWQFGPYQQQGGLLALGLIARGHTVSWVATRGWSEPLADGEASVLPSPSKSVPIRTSNTCSSASGSLSSTIRMSMDLSIYCSLIFRSMLKTVSLSQ